jgi:hypothetical protein
VTRQNDALPTNIWEEAGQTMRGSVLSPHSCLSHHLIILQRATFILIHLTGALQAAKMDEQQMARAFSRFQTFLPLKLHLGMVSDVFLL